MNIYTIATIQKSEDLLVEGRHQHVEPEVKLVTVQKKRVSYVPLHYYLPACLQEPCHAMS